MKKLLFLLSALLAVLLLSSCSGGGEPTETGSGTAAGTDAGTGEGSPDKEAAYMQAKLEALKILTPTVDKDGFVLKDDRIHQQMETRDGEIFLEERLPNSDQYREDRFLSLTKEYLYSLTDDGEAELLCKKEGCTHDGLECTALASQVLFNFTDEETGEVYIYYIINLPLTSVHINGEIVDLSEELGQYIYGWSDAGLKMIHVLFEYNMTTGVRRAIKLDYATFPFSNYYYNGKLYVFYERHSEEKFTSTYDVLMMVDVKTGESAFYGGGTGSEPCGVYFAGIEDGSLYVVRAEDGMLIKSAPDFSGAEEIGVVEPKEDELFEESWDFSGSEDIFDDEASIVYFFFHVTDGYLYVARSEPGMIDLYRCKLSLEGGLETVAMDINLRGELNGIETGGERYIYYSPYSPEKEDDENAIYRYNIGTGETEVVYEDGPEPGTVYYVDDERIIYKGYIRRVYNAGTDAYDTVLPDVPIEGIPDDISDDLSIFHAYFEYNFSTGVHRVIYIDEYQTPRIPANK